MEEKISISGVPETMLQTLCARAMESKKENPAVYDPMAIKIVEKLDYDFSKAQSDKAMSSGVIARTILLDKMTEDFLNSNKNAAVINIACGLDTRCWRMEGKYCKWYNLDLPETMEIRSRFLKETENIRQISCSAADESWTDRIEPHEGPLLIIIEGLTMYLSEEDVKKIFSIIDKNFKNVTIFAETMNPIVVKHVKEKSIEGSRAKFVWGVKNGKELQKLLPEFHVLSDRSLTEGMAVFMPIYKLLGKIPFIRNISNKIIVLEK